VELKLTPMRFRESAERIVAALPRRDDHWLSHPSIIGRSVSCRAGVLKRWHQQQGTKEESMSDSRAVALARAHLEAWTNHDLDTVRRNLADDVQFYSPAANLAGAGEYMDAPRGLTQFAKQVVSGSLRIIAATGDERNALIMYEVRTAGGPVGAKVFLSAQTWLLDEAGKIKVERIISYASDVD
jgi:hypothetical protein